MYTYKSEVITNHRVSSTNGSGAYTNGTTDQSRVNGGSSNLSDVIRRQESGADERSRRSTTPTRRTDGDRSPGRTQDNGRSTGTVVSASYRPYFVPTAESTATNASSSYVAPVPYTLDTSAQRSEAEKAQEKSTLVKSLFKEGNKQDDHRQILNRLDITGDLFWDAEFPPQWSSLWGFGEPETLVDVNFWKSFQWKRATELSSQVVIFDVDTSPRDLVQGYLADSYFVSSVSAIAENSHRIKKLFVTDTRNKYGCYCLKLAVNGAWQEIVLDDFLPYSPLDSKPAFTRCEGTEIWAMLLEKAWAKLHRGYLNIDVGDARECLNSLTNAPTESISLGEPNVWTKILEGCRNKFIMTAGSSSPAGRDIISQIGLVGSHSYTVLGAFYVLVEGIGRARLARDGIEEASKNCRRIVKLRNAWGSDEWKGDWSNKCFLWTEQLKTEIGKSDSEDGTFFMDFQDFKKYFSDINICHYHENFTNTSAQYESESDAGNYFRVTITQPGVYYFSCHQPGASFFPHKANYKYSKINCVAAHMEDPTQFGYIGGVQKTQREVWIRCPAVVRGDYLFYVKPTWETSNRKFFLSIYGPDSVNIDKIEKATLNKGLALNAIYLDRARKTQQTYKTFAVDGESDIRYFQDEFDEGYGYFYFENNSTTTELTCWLSIKYMSNIRLMYPHSGRDARIRLLPGQREIVLYRVLSYPAKISYTVLPYFRRSITALKALASKLGNKVTKVSRTGDDVGIYLYKYKTESEVVFYYVNNSSSYSLSEHLDFQLAGCRLEGVTGNTVDLILGPKEDRIFRVVPLEDNELYRVRVITSNSTVNPA